MYILPYIVALTCETFNFVLYFVLSLFIIRSLDQGILLFYPSCISVTASQSHTGLFTGLLYINILLVTLVILHWYFA